MSEQEQTLDPSTDRPVDRAVRPPVPAAVSDLWDGWGYTGLSGIEGAEHADARALGTALKGITSVVNAMAGGDLYRVGLLGQGTAYTDLKARLVNVTTAALRDPRLTLDEALGVTTAMAVHEAGHGRVSRPMERAVKAAWKSDPAAEAKAHRLSNIVDDVRLEADTAAQWPAYGGLFPLALWWVAQRYPSGGITRLPASQAEALNLAIAAIRYDDLTTWSPDPALQAERAWWKQWGADAAQQQRPMDHVAAIRVALDRLGSLPEAVEPPMPSAPVMPGESDEDEQDGDEQDDAPAFGEAEDALDEDESDEDEADGWGDQDESDEDEADGEGDSGDEPMDAEGLPGEADGAGDQDGESDGATSAEPTEGTAVHGHEADDEQDDLPEDARWDDDGENAEATYHHSDENADGDEALADEGGDDIVYGRTEDTEWDRDGATTLADDPEQQPERDALTDSLPAHATEAVTSDDRDRDIALGQAMVQTSRREAKDQVEVVHNGVHKRTAGIVPLETDRTSIATNPAVQGALRAAFTSRRTSRDNRDVARSGRISGSRAYRVRAGFDNVFTRRDGVSPDRLDIHLLVDASGSMAGRSGEWGRRGRTGPKRVEQAAQMAANITEALAALPFVRVHVWAHNTVNGTTVWDVYDSRRGDKVGKMAGIRAAAANNDATAIAALSSRITDERTSRERSIMVVISDGAPCEDESWVRAAVDKARRDKVGVMSVAIAGGLTHTQEACYGPEWVVPWTDWDSLARDIARMIGRLG
jgi:hypothetical protein